LPPVSFFGLIVLACSKLIPAVRAPRLY
jgi:hypothetical protein